ncbi:MAG: nitroreductase family protein [Paramuribaculum sp.]|nr:nitroreductase family protein [Paramuribaculum sp.]
MSEDYFKNRRSIRRYSDQAVDDKTVKELLALAANAPTTGNMQLYSVVITRDDEKKATLAPAHFNQPAIMNAKVVLTFCADFNRFSRWCTLSNAEPCYDNLQSLVTAILDTTIVAQQFVTLAEMRGLGTCYLGTTTYNAPMIAEKLNLPTLVVPVITVTLGWPEEKAEDPGRLPSEAFIHEETYDDVSDEKLKELYAEKEDREDSKKFVAENGKETLAQVFTDVRYPRGNNEHFSKVLMEFIKSAGYKMPE